jgi:AAA ATPase-like protein
MPQPAGPHDPEVFVGRSHELAVLSAALRQATTGDARLALVSGEPGIGKPGLARAFARAARSDDALVLRGSADADVLAVVQRRSEGNPLFVSQVARLLGPGAATVEEVPVPAGIRQAVRRQVAWLADAKAATGDNTPGAEEILATAAALGPGIDPALVAAALGIPAGPVARLCDDATAIGLLGPGQDVGEVYGFRHALTLRREDDFWLVGFADAVTRVPDSLGLRYLDLLIRHPGRDLAALDLVQLAAATGPAAAAAEDGLHDASGAGADEVVDQQARTAYRQRLTALDEELAEAEAWHDTERASRLRAEKDFLVRELAAVTGLGGRPRRLGAESERARLNVTRAIRSAIARIRDRAPATAAHLDQAVRTGTRCSYTPPDG